MVKQLEPRRYLNENRKRVPRVSELVSSVDSKARDHRQSVLRAILEMRASRGGVDHIHCGLLSVVHPSSVVSIVCCLHSCGT